MQITGTLTEFLLMLALGAILLLVGVILASGVSRNANGWRIPKAHWVFTLLFFIFAASVIGIALYEKATAYNGVAAYGKPFRLDEDRDFEVPQDGLIYIGCGDPNPAGSRTPSGRIDIIVASNPQIAHQVHSSDVYPDQSSVMPVQHGEVVKPKCSGDVTIIFYPLQFGMSQPHSNP